MRLRVKLCDKSSQSTSTSIRVQDDCTLQQLHVHVSQEVLKAESLGEYRLSLNKKVRASSREVSVERHNGANTDLERAITRCADIDFLVQDELLGDPGSSLKALGLCSGDLLWVMSDCMHPVPNPLQACLPESLDTSDAAPGVDIVSVIGTAAEAQITCPVFSISSSVEALRLLIHAALLDSGLEPLQVSVVICSCRDQVVHTNKVAYSIHHNINRGTRGAKRRLCMLAQVASNGGAAAASYATELQYVLRASTAHGGAAHRAACSIKYVNFGSNLVVWGTTASKGTCHISIAAADYISSHPESRDQSLPESVSQPTLYGKDIDKLHMRLKDGLIHPILIALCAEEGRPPPPSFLLLPTEIKLLCLRHLQVCLQPNLTFTSTQHRLIFNVS